MFSFLLCLVPIIAMCSCYTLAIWYGAKGNNKLMFIHGTIAFNATIASMVLWYFILMSWLKYMCPFSFH